MRDCNYKVGQMCIHLFPHLFSTINMSLPRKNVHVGTNGWFLVLLAHVFSVYKEVQVYGTIISACDYPTSLINAETVDGFLWNLNATSSHWRIPRLLALWFQHRGQANWATSKTRATSGSEFCVVHGLNNCGTSVIVCDDKCKIQKLPLR
jgi:hypothetical protein